MERLVGPPACDVVLEQRRRSGDRDQSLALRDLDRIHNSKSLSSRLSKENFSSRLEHHNLRHLLTLARSFILALLTINIFRRLFVRVRVRVRKRSKPSFERICSGIFARGLFLRSSRPQVLLVLHLSVLPVRFHILWDHTITCYPSI